MKTFRMRMASMSGTAWTAAYSIYGAFKLTPRLMRGLSGTFSALVAHTSKVVLYGELSTGHRDRGAPKKRYQDCLKKSLNVCHIDCQQWSDMAVDPGATQSTRLLHCLKRTGETPSKTNDRGGKLKLLPPPKTQT